MRAEETEFKGVFIIDPDVFGDKRGYFMETYHQEKYEKLGIAAAFVQDNMSFSVKWTLRGLHFQHPYSQAKLVQAVKGEIFDVIVDIRRGSPSFGQWEGFNLSDQNKRQLYVPKGFAHGFCVLSETALVQYKCGDFYAPESEGGVLWSDPGVGIEWPLSDPLISDRDSRFPALKDFPAERLPIYEEK